MTFEEMDRSIDRLVQTMDRDRRERHEQQQEWNDRWARDQQERHEHQQEWNERWAHLAEAIRDNEDAAVEMRRAMSRSFERMDRQDDSVTELRAAMARLAQTTERSIGRHDEEIAEFRAAMHRLFEHMDRFIRGLDRGNGKS